MAEDVQYISFENGAPDLSLPSSYTDDQVRDYLKSEKFQGQMFENGYGYTYGQTPVNLLDEDNLDDNAIQAGAKSAISTLKQIGQGALATMYDLFGNEEKQREAIELVKQYQLDSMANQYRRDADGNVRQRITTLEQVMESEEEFSSFLSWLGNTVGQGAVTSVPFFLAGALTGGVGAIAAGTAGRALAGGALKAAGRSLVPSLVNPTSTLGKLGAATLPISPSGIGLFTSGYVFGAGDTYVNQLEETDDPNAAIALAAGIPYAFAETAFGAGGMLLNTMIGKSSAAQVKASINAAKKGGPVIIDKTISKATKAQRAKAFGSSLLQSSSGEAVAEGLQESITQTGQAVEGGRSLSELYASTDFWKQVGEGSAAGFAGGGPFGAVGGTIQAMRIGPSMDIKIKGSGESILLPKIDTSVLSDPELWNELDFQPADIVTYTGAPVVTEIDGTTSEDFKQPNANDNATRTYFVAGTAEFQGKKHIALVSTDNKTEMFVPIEGAGNILSLSKEQDDIAEQNAIDEIFDVTNTTSNGYLFDSAESENVNLNRTGVDRAFAENLDTLRRRGYGKGITSLAVTKAAQKKWVEEQLTQIQFKVNEFNNLKKAHDAWLTAGKPDERENRPEFYDGAGEPIEDWNTVIQDNFGYKIPGEYRQYLPYFTDEVGLREQLNTKGWEQEKLRKSFQAIQNNNDNIITETQRRKINELGYDSPEGQKFLKSLLEDEHYTGGVGSKSRGRLLIDKLIKEKVTFGSPKYKEYFEDAAATKASAKKAEIPLNVVLPDNEAGPATIQQIRTSLLGEGLYEMSVSDRLNAIRDLIEDLDTVRSKKYKVALDKTSINTLKIAIKKYRKAGADAKALKAEASLLTILDETYLISSQYGIMGSFSENAAVGIEIKLNRLNKKKVKTTEDIIIIDAYSDHLDTIKNKRNNLNSLLNSFNIESITTNEGWNKFNGAKTLQQLRDINNKYTIDTMQSPVAESWMAAKQGKGEPRLSENFARNSVSILQTLKENIAKLGLDIQVDLVPFLERDGAVLAAGYVPGSRSITVALNGIPQMLRRQNGLTSLTGEVADDITDIDRVNFLLYHEVMHVLSTQGFFKQHEFAALKKAAKDQWIDRYSIRERYPNDAQTQALLKQEGMSYENLLVEEAISEAFADYMTGRFMMKGPIARAFDKLKKYLIALGNALTGNRFNRPESIFNQIDLGIVGQRFKTLQRSNVVYDGGINGAKIITTDRNWSGTGALDGYNLIPWKRSFMFGSRQDGPMNTEEFFKWFNKGGRESVVTTDTGAPLVVMHTTKTMREGAPFNTFNMGMSKDFGMHFTATQRHIDYIQRYNPENVGERYHTFNGFLQLSNPLRMPDLLTWDAPTVVQALFDDGIITREQGNKLLNDNPSVEVDTGEEIVQNEDAFFKAAVKLLKSKGYDGIIYKNIGEDIYRQRESQRAPGEIPINPQDIIDEKMNPAEDSYIIFDSTQFKHVDNTGGYDTKNPDMMASRQWQESEGGMPDDQYVPLNRQQERDLNRRAMAARQGVDKSTDAGANFGGKALSWINRWFGAMREWSANNLPFAELFTVMQTMNYKAQSLQAQLTNELALYRAIVDSDPEIALLMRKAQALSQHYQDQGRGTKFFKNENGQIILSAPMDFKGGPKDIDIQPGETIVLDGDVANAFLQYDKVMDKALTEIRKGLVAGTYADELVEAITMLNKIDRVELEAEGQQFIQENWAQRNLSTTELEELTGLDVEAIVKGLLTQATRISVIGPPTRGVSELDKKEIQRLRAMAGFLPNGQVNAKSQNGLGRLMQELKKYDRMREGTYVPFMRFGKFYIKVVNPNIKEGKEGRTVEYQMFESRGEAQAALGGIQNKYVNDSNAVVSTVAETTIKELKQAVKDKAISLADIGQYLSESSANTFSQLEPELERIIAENKDIVGFDTFLTPRSRVGGVAGYSADFGRAASQFIFMASRTAARNRFMPEARRKYNAVKQDAELRDDKRLAEGLDTFWDYTNDPKQEFAAFRQLGFWFYLGGNMSSAILQVMSNVQFTGPILAEVTPGGKGNLIGQKGATAAARLLKAQKEAISMLSFTHNEFGDTFINWDSAPERLINFIKEDMAGYLKQGQALHEAGQVPGTENLGSRQKRAFRQFENAVIGGMFNTMEATSRLTAYIAAMDTFLDGKDGNVALDRFNNLYEDNQLLQAAKNENGGVLTPQIATRFLIDETFGVYGKLNRPAIMRKYGAIPALFQTYISQMFALTYRMLTGGSTPQQKAAGRRVFLRMMGMIVLTGGMFGIPGSDDAEDFASWMVETVPGVGSGLKTDFRAMIREMLYDTGLSARKVNAIENGFIEAYLNLDVQRRLSLGNIPFSQQVRALAGMMGLSNGGKAADFAGAPGSVFMTPIKEGFTALREGRGLVDVAFKSSPLFIRNGYKAYQQSVGKGFVETNYGTVLRDDVTIGETMKQAMGFGSAKTKRMREAEYMARFYETRGMKKQKQMSAQITNAFRDILIGNKNNDSELSIAGQQRVNELTRELYKWNSSVDPKDAIFVNIDRLWDEAMKSSSKVVRDLSLSPQTQKRMQKFREMYDF